MATATAAPKGRARTGRGITREPFFDHLEPEERAALADRVGTVRGGVKAIAAAATRLQYHLMRPSSLLSRGVLRPELERIRATADECLGAVELLPLSN